MTIDDKVNPGWEDKDWKIVEPENICVWKEIYNQNQEGEGTTFGVGQYVKCQECKGYEQSCKNYLNVHK